MKLGYKARLVLFIAAQATAITLVAVLLYQPAVAAVRSIHQEMDRLSQKQAELCNVLKENTDPEGDIARAKKEIQRLEQRMPPESRISWLSARVADAMRAHHVDLRSSATWSEGGEKPIIPALKRLQKQITVRCPAQDLQAFLTSLNKLPFVVVVEDIQVDRDQKWGAVLADIRLATFVLRARSGTAGLNGETP